MRFTINPITDEFDVVGLGSGVFDETITGNTGGAVPPDGSGNINLLGDNTTGINIVGSPGVSTLRVFGLASTTTQIGTTRYSTNAEAAAQSVTTAALTPSNITSMFSTSYLPATQGGTGLSSPAAHSLLVTNGSSAFTVLGTASNGQLPIGSIGSDPVLANITSSGGTITVTNGPGTINIDLVGGTTAVDSIGTQTGTNPIVPTGAGLVTINGAVVAAGTNPVRSDGTGANTMAIEVQTSQAIAAADATKIGLSNFDSASFAVAATGFVTLSTVGALKTLTGDTGTATPVANNIQIAGGPGVTTSATGAVVTINAVTFSDTTATTLVVDNGYFATAAGTYPLPVTAAQGEILIVVCDTAGAVVLDAPADNFIRVGSAITTNSGTATSNAIGDFLVLRYRLSTLTWMCVGVGGTWTLA